VTAAAAWQGVVARAQERFFGHYMRRRFVLPLATVLYVLFAVPQSLAASPEQTYMRDCAVCHLPGIAGAPKVGDRAEWGRRVRAGLNNVYRNALEGVPNTAMSAKGGQTDLSDDLVRSIVDYMIDAAALDASVLEAAKRYDKLGITDRDFIRLDANFDGFLGPQELKNDPVLVANLKRFDENRDGRLSEMEFRKAEATLERERIAANVDDATLAREVRTALGKVAGIDMESTKIEADQGVVSIVGIVSTAETVRQAYAAVKRIPGVKKVDSRLVSGEQIGWD
jgi:cytochrome c5